MNNKNYIVIVITCNIVLPSLILHAQENRYKQILEERRALYPGKSGVYPEPVEGKDKQQNTAMNTSTQKAENEPYYAPQDGASKGEEIAEPVIKQAQLPVARPSTLQIIYRLLPQVFVQSFSTGSDVGIAAFTKNVIKQFIKRHQVSAAKKEFEIEKLGMKDNILNLAKKDYQQYDLSGASEENKKDFLQDLLHKYQNKLESKLEKDELIIKQLEEQTAASFIFKEAASTALIYTLAAMTGEVLKFGISIGLQLLMPNVK